MARIEELRERDQTPDYVTIVPDGEPTLDCELGGVIDGVIGSGVPVAVITNGSLLADEAVRRDLARADWVSVKIDAADQAHWRRIDRPDRSLVFDDVISGMRRFADEFRGTLATETMLVAGLNDGEDELAAIAEIAASLSPDVAYISVPTRPPAESWVEAPNDDRIIAAHHVFLDSGLPAELNISFDTGEFTVGDDVADGILSVAAVHPIERGAIEAILDRSGAPWALVETLIDANRLLARRYRDREYFVTNLRLRRNEHTGSARPGET
jgi:wyosine [tRNA(Phe)-imidazoG37] synthetase (radical SAM superfamily)